ncbi:MAG: hypothetical protein Q7J07_05395, partial [Pelolinea sp.]|nr:hypothetical protein [Pelolinea sp.]
GKGGSVIPFPLFYRFGNESVYEVSQRYLDVVRKIDPYLQTASIEGWNPLWRIGTYAGMILAAMGYQISEAEQLISNPLLWEARMKQAINTYPDICPAVNYLLNLTKEKEGIRSRKSESFFNKISIFALDSSMKAMFGASQAGIDWNRVVSEKITVLLDFRGEHDVERRRFKMVWAFNYLLEFVKHRGAGRHQPIGLIIDELTSLFSVQALASDLFGSELDELINVLARNYRLWLTIAHQEKFQLTDNIFLSLMTMGTQILGVTTDPMAANFLSELFFEYEAYKVKKYIPTYGSVNGVPQIIDYTTDEFTIEEQTLMRSYFFRNQRAFHFLVRPAPGEGNIQSKLREMSIARLDEGIYPHPYYVPLARQKLMQRDGVKIEDILQEIASRRIVQLPGLSGGSGIQTKLERKKDVPIWD